MTDFYTDGATLPSFFRKWIEMSYSKNVIYQIDSAGVYHDILTYFSPDTPVENRKRFIEVLNKYNVPTELVILINFGLWIYDISNPFLKNLLLKYLV